MALYSSVRHTTRPLSIDDYEPTMGEYLSAVWNEGLSYNPVQSSEREQAVKDATVDLQQKEPSLNASPLADWRAARNMFKPVKTLTALSTDDQTRFIKDNGLEGQLQPKEGYTKEALDILVAHKKEENYWALVREKAPMSYAPLGLVASLGAGFVDPVNIASAFVPVVGEARMINMLRVAGTRGGRALVRAKVGFAEGLVGAAMVEPMVYSSQQTLQSDYDMASSLLNIGFGAVMGAALRPAAGAVGEWLGRKRIQPWEMAAPTDETEALRSDMANRIEQTFLGANPTADTNEVHHLGQAASAAFDARARSWAYDTNKPVQEYYTQYGPKFANEHTSQQGAANAIISLPQSKRLQEVIGYEQTRMGKEARTSLQEDIEAFRKTVDRIATSKARQDKPVLMLKGTPLVLQAIGGDSQVALAAAKGGIYITGHALDGHHSNVTPKVLKQLPKALADPIAIFKSVEKVDGKIVERENNLVFMLEVTDDRGATTILPIQLGAKKDSTGATITLVKTAFAKDNKKGPVNKWFVDQIYKHKTALYVNRKKLRRWSEIHRVQFPEESLHSVYGRTLPSEWRLVNLRERDPSLYQGGPDAPRGRIDFYEDGQTVINFFKSSDFSTAFHEMFHLFRREMEETALSPEASERAKARWKAVEEFVGAKPGQKWTPEMEEKFARAGERYLREGVAPSSALRQVFEKVKQWFVELYADADKAGLEISPEMRQVFDSMFSVPESEADNSFRYALGDLATREWERDFANENARFDEAVSSGDLDTVEGLTRDAEAEVNDAMSRVAQSEPEIAQAVDKEFTEALAEVDAEITHAELRQQVMDEAALCVMNR